MTTNLKDKAINSMIWVTIDKVGGYFLLFISNMVLARLLMPEDFGCIAMLHVFLAISGIIIHGGFGAALIQKKKPTQVDCNSAFYINIAASIALYFLLFAFAPSIARFYSMPLLCKLLRIFAIILVITSFTVVQLSILKKEFKFKELAVRNLISGFMGAVAGVICAVLGLGVWSLVINALVSSLIGVILLWRASSWRPTLEFSWQSAKELFGFGGFLMLSSIIASIYDELQSILVGKYYSSRELGFVNQARKLESIPSAALSSVVSQVSFPIFSTLKDNTTALKYGLKKNIKSIQYINLPMMLLLMVIAEPLIDLIYGVRWATCVPYFQILCVSRLLGVCVPLNMNIISAKGRGKLYFFIQLIKCSFSIGVIVLSIHHGIYALMFALALIPFFEFVVCSIVNQKLIHYGLFQQLRDILPTFGIAVLSAAIAFCLKYVIEWHPYIVMIVQSLACVVLYIVITKFLKFEAYDIYYDVFMNKILKKRKKI